MSLTGLAGILWFRVAPLFLWVLLILIVESNWIYSFLFVFRITSWFISSDTPIRICAWRWGEFKMIWHCCWAAIRLLRINTSSSTQILAIPPFSRSWWLFFISIFWVLITSWSGYFLLFSSRIRLYWIPPRM